MLKFSWNKSLQLIASNSLNPFSCSRSGTIAAVVMVYLAFVQVDGCQSWVYIYTPSRVCHQPYYVTMHNNMYSLYLSGAQRESSVHKVEFFCLLCRAELFVCICVNLCLWFWYNSGEFVCSICLCRVSSLNQFLWRCRKQFNRTYVGGGEARISLTKWKWMSNWYEKNVLALVPNEHRGNLYFSNAKVDYILCIHFDEMLSNFSKGINIYMISLKFSSFVRFFH